jgi:agmatine/peptidylarginine deiminase
MVAWPHKDTDWAEMLSAAESNFAEMIAAISLATTPWILIPDVETQSYVESMVNACLTAKGWHQQHELEFSVCTYDDTWTRDYGPLCVFKSSEQVGQKHLRLQDFIFNGWGNKFNAEQDNLVNQTLWESGEFQRVYISKLYQEKLFSVQFQSYDWVLEGGSLETNGSLLLSTTACLLNKNRNPLLSEPDIKAQLTEQFGANKLLWLTEGHLEGDDTDAHIDTLARFIDQNTIIYQGCQDTGDNHYKCLQAMKQQLETIAVEHDLQLLELPWPKAHYEDGRRLPATYANFLIVNQHVLLPTYGCEQDVHAIDVIAQAFPELIVVPVDCQTLIRNNGSLHCSTMQLPHIWSKS